MRVVLDTNVLISGIFFSGPPFKILEAWRDRRLALVVSPEILEEYYRVGENLGSRYSDVDITACTRTCYGQCGDSHSGNH